MANNCGESSEEANRGPAAGKTTKGRQKIEIKQLEKKNNLHVTFSKRRNGLFKKASELCILSGAKIGVVVLSPRPREKPFSFGHPNIEKLLDRYLGDQKSADAAVDCPAAAAAPTDAPLDDQERAILRDLPGFEEFSKKFEEALEELEKEKNRGKEMENHAAKFWWDEEIEGMGLEELEIYVNAMENLKKNVIARTALTMENIMENSAPADRDAGFGFAQNLPRSKGL